MSIQIMSPINLPICIEDSKYNIHVIFVCDYVWVPLFRNIIRHYHIIDKIGNDTYDNDDDSKWWEDHSNQIIFQSQWLELEA